MPRVALSRPTARALRGAALAVARAHLDREFAIVAAHEGGASMPDIAQHLGMDAFDVRDVLVRRGALSALRPKETGRSG